MADVSEAELSEAEVSEADVSEADVSEADASEADVSETDVNEVEVSEADVDRVRRMATRMGEGVCWGIRNVAAVAALVWDVNLLVGETINHFLGCLVVLCTA